MQYINNNRRERTLKLAIRATTFLYASYNEIVFAPNIRGTNLDCFHIPATAFLLILINIVNDAAFELGPNPRL